MTTTLRNDKTGETITCTHSNAEAAKLFADHFGGRDSWLWFWIHKTISKLPKPGEAGLTSAIGLIADSFVIAAGRGLKRPMIRLHYRNQRFKIYLSEKGTLCVKTGRLIEGTHDPVGDEYYIGCLLRGDFLVARTGGYDSRGPERILTEVEKEFIGGLKADPVAFLAKCSKDMGRCCYCNLPLEDARSKEAGYGATCAKRWGLPWGKDKATMEAAPSFAKVYGPDMAMLCQAVRKAPRDAFAWGVLSDYLKENSLLEISMPKDGNVRLPRADSEGEATPTSKSAPKVESPKVEEPAPVEVGALPAVAYTALGWDAVTKTFTTEASDLGWKPGEWPPVVLVKGAFSTKRFENNSTKLVGGEVTDVRYKSEDGFTLVVYND